MQYTKWVVAAVLAVAAGAGGWQLWSKLRPHGLGDGFASGNGRIEATEVDIATKLPGRIADELADEGDFVTARQVVAHMNTESLQAQLREAKAKLGMANSAVEAARATVAQQESVKVADEAVVAQCQADYDLAAANLHRGATDCEECH